MNRSLRAKYFRFETYLHKEGRVSLFSCVFAAVREGVCFHVRKKFVKNFSYFSTFLKNHFKKFAKLNLRALELKYSSLNSLLKTISKPLFHNSYSTFFKDFPAKKLSIFCYDLFKTFLILLLSLKWFQISQGKHQFLATSFSLHLSHDWTFWTQAKLNYISKFQT